jgi:hypothetical protein
MSHARIGFLFESLLTDGSKMPKTKSVLNLGCLRVTKT